MNKKSAFNILRIVISAGLILFLFWLMRNSFGNVVLAIKKTDKLILFFAFLSLILGLSLLGVRLKFIMRTQHLNITLKEAISLTFIGHFFNNFLPTAVGGDLVKAYYISKDTGKKMAAIACIILDRLLGTFTLILMVLFTYLFVKEAFYNKSIIIFLVIAVAISFILCLVLFSRRTARRIPFIGIIVKKFNLTERMKGLYEIIYNYKSQPTLILNAISLSILLQVVFFYAVYLVIKGLNFSVPVKWVFLVMPIISTVSMAPSINGLGVREGSFVFFFGTRMGKEGAFALSLLWLGLNFSASLIGGILYLFKKDAKVKEVLKYDR